MNNNRRSVSTYLKICLDHVITILEDTITIFKQHHQTWKMLTLVGSVLQAAEHDTVLADRMARDSIDKM